MMRFIYLLLALSTLSCAKRDLVYLSDLEDEDLNKQTGITNTVTSTIQPDDLLSITVNSLSVESNMLFNQGVLGTLGSKVTNQSSASTQGTIEGYLVNSEGIINFPVIGEIKLAGLTKEEATDTIRNILNRDYVKDPTVNIRFLNYKITLIGEVSNPAVYTILTEKINVLEAISLAGDLTAVGKRENVLVIREQDGLRTMFRVNLNDKNLVNSPSYYLQQNDIVYVEPDKYKRATSSLTRTNLTFFLSLTMTMLTMMTLIITLNNK